MKPIPLRIARPWPIVVYCAVTLVGGVYDLVVALADLETWRESLEEFVAAEDATRELAIVTASALFTIVLIPLVALWFFASRIARLFVSAIAALFIAGSGLVAAQDGVASLFENDAESVTLAFAASLAVVLLYVPDARDWFARRGFVDADVFN